MTNRTLALVAALVWIAAFAMAGAYLWNGATVGSASGAQASAEDPAATATTTAVDASSTSLPTTTTVAPTTSSSTSTTTSTTTPATTSTTEAAPPALVVAAGGDVLGDRGVGSFIDEHGGDAVLAQVKPFMEDAHVAFVNLECPVSDKGARNPYKEYTFRGRPALAGGLLSAGIDVVSLANNHTLDYGSAALLDTIGRLDDTGVAHAGAGSDSSAAREPALLITPAGMVAVLAFTEIVPGGFEATSKQPGVNSSASDRKRALSDIASARERADFVIVSFHWGTEYTGQAGASQRSLAHAAVDAGADLVLGHHPHVIQGLEVYKGRLIAYSLGDFVFDHFSRQTGEAFVLRVTLTAGRTLAAEIVPVYLDDTTGVPAPVTDEEADVILSRLASLSARLGLELSRSGDRASYAAEAATSPAPAASP